MIRRSTAALAAALFVAAAPAAATEYTRFVMLCLPGIDDDGRATGCAELALLNLPQGWQEGDTAAVLFSTEPVVDATRDPLVAGLLANGTAVLEVTPGLMQGLDAFPGQRELLRIPRSPLDELMRGLVALHATARAGVVIAIGYGPGAEGALEAMREDVARLHVGTDGPRFAAAAALGGAEARFVGTPGRAGVDARVGALCLALEPEARETARHCFSALVGLNRRRHDAAASAPPRR